MKDKYKGRPSTFQGWVIEESGPVTTIPVEEYDGYESDYMKAYNACKTTGCSIKEDKWTDPQGYQYESVFECYRRYAKKRLEDD